MRGRALAITGIFLPALYDAYVHFGVEFLSSRSLHALIICEVMPQTLPSGWKVMPFPRRFVDAAIKSKAPLQVQKELRDWRGTLYGVLEFRDVASKSSDARPKYQVQLLETLTTYL
jgi:hypothetical protein